MKTTKIYSLALSIFLGCGATLCHAQRSSLFVDPQGVQTAAYASVDNNANPVRTVAAQFVPVLPGQQNGGNPGYFPPPFLPPQQLQQQQLQQQQLQQQQLQPPPQPPPQGPAQGPSPLAGSSWIYTPQAPPRQLAIHDIINIRVDETSQVTASGSAQSRKNASLDIKLSDWVRFAGLGTIKPTPETDGEPRIAGQDNEVYRADSTLRTRESLTFNIAAEIADIRPNGQIVLSANKSIQDNDNIWELSLTGICRPQDIGPDNVVLSRDIFDSKISKNERGQVREGYSRGFITRWFGRFKPF